MNYNSDIITAIGLIHLVYQHHASGGPLHIVLDDLNYQRSHIEWCKGIIDDHNYTNQSSIEESRELLHMTTDHLLAMGDDEVRRALAMYYDHPIDDEEWNFRP